MTFPGRGPMFSATVGLEPGRRDKSRAMDITVEELGACRRRLTVEVPVDRVNETFRDVTVEYTQYAQIKGFRPGKAPTRVVRARYAKQIADEVKDRLVPDGYRAAMEQESLVPVAVLEVENDAPAAEQPFRFTVTCDVAPEFPLPTYRNLKLTSDRVEVSEADVDAALTSVQERFASFEDVERTAVAGDLVQIDYQGTVDGQAIETLAPDAKGLGGGEDFWMQAGPEAFLPELGEGVLGAALGEAVEIPVTFPDAFGEEAVRGRTALYTVTVKRVREKHVEDLTEEQLSQLGVASEEELRERIQTDLGSHRDAEERQQLKNQAIGLLVDGTAFDLPESVVQDETKNTIYEMVQDIARRGTPEEHIQERKDELFGLASQNAAAKVKVRYVLARIAEEEKIEVSTEDLSARVGTMAARSGMPPEELFRELKDRNQLDNLEQDLRFEKTLELILEEAEIVRS